MTNLIGLTITPFNVTLTTFNVIVMMVVVAFFAWMARKFWKNDIGAGPTILIVGALLLWGFVSYLYATGASKQRSDDAKVQQETNDFYVCVGKVDRSVGNRAQHEAIIAAIEGLKTDQAAEIASVLQTQLDLNLPPLNYASCLNPLKLPLPAGDTITPSTTGSP